MLKSISETSINRLEKRDQYLKNTPLNNIQEYQDISLLTTTQLLSLRNRIFEELSNRIRYSLTLKYKVSENIYETQQFGSFPSINIILSNEMFNKALSLLSKQTNESWLFITDEYQDKVYYIASKFENSPAYYDGWYLAYKGIKNNTDNLENIFSINQILVDPVSSDIV